MTRVRTDLSEIHKPHPAPGQVSIEILVLRSERIVRSGAWETEDVRVHQIEGRQWDLVGA